ncbi:unnamed protein product [Ixodes pacificus]
MQLRRLLRDRRLLAVHGMRRAAVAALAGCLLLLDTGEQQTHQDPDDHHRRGRAPTPRPPVPPSRPLRDRTGAPRTGGERENTQQRSPRDDVAPSPPHARRARRRSRRTPVQGRD